LKTSPPLSPDGLLMLIRGRRSIRRYESQPIPHETLARLLEAARWAPSAHNRQPWRFVLITDPGDRRLLADRMAARLAADLRADGVDEAAIAKDTERSRLHLTGAPVLVLVCLTMTGMDAYPDTQRQSAEHAMAVQSAAMAGQNLLLMAHAEGLGACWMCAPLFCPDTVRQALNLPPDYEPQGVIGLGYPAETRRISRRAVESFTLFL
jgi:coenzyme F420-0:L-glutamate ligase/coenzyme F420-1:gamma-L-glutamate ligase